MTCPHGWFGKDCSQPCQCQNGGDCHYKYGKCNCTAGKCLVNNPGIGTKHKNIEILLHESHIDI
jgi:hypothetical protein